MHRARLNRLRSLEEEVMTCGFITEHEGHFCFVVGTGNRSRAAEADYTFLAYKKPPPGLAERCHDIWGSTNQKMKRGNCWTFSFLSLSSTILNMTLFSAFNLDHTPAAFTKKQKPLWFHFSGNFVLLGKKANKQHLLFTFMLSRRQTSERCDHILI